MYFYSGVNGRDEDLLQTHKVKLDKKRDRQWEAEKRIPKFLKLKSKLH